MKSDSLPQNNPPFWEGNRGRWLRAWSGPALILAGGACMLWLGWRRWADVLIDFGNQLYIPWQIAQGEVLYKDLFYVFGVLSPYLHALIFWIFGPGALYLSLFNIGLTLVLTAVIYKMVDSLSGKLTATLGAFSFLVVHALGHHRYLANFNFIQPYSYDLTHGMFLAFVALAVFMRYIKVPSTGRLIGIGLLLGLILLTKVEVMFAIGIAMAAGLMVVFIHYKMPAHQIALNILALVAVFLIPAALALLYFSTQMPITQAFYDMFLPVEFSLRPEVKHLPYYKWVMGTDMLAENSAYMLLYAMVFLFMAAGLAWINQKLNQAGRNSPPAALAASLIMILLIWFFFWEIPWKLLLNPLPLITLATSWYFFWKAVKTSSSGFDFYKNTALFVLSLFAFLLLTKIFFRSVIYHYGFALTFPGSLVVIILVTDTIPSWLRKQDASLCFYRITSTALLASYIFVMTYDSYLYYSKKVIPVGKGVDLFYEYAPNSRTHFGRPFMEPIATRFLLEHIENNFEPSSTFAVFPDAVMINYLSRHKDPLGGFLLNPFTWILVGGDGPVIRLLESNTPDYIILVHRQYPEWGMRYFGKDFGKGIYQWLLDHYSPTQRIGAVPFTDNGFGAQVYRLKQGPDTASNQ